MSMSAPSSSSAAAARLSARRPFLCLSLSLSLS
jgi:hypothetical protein